MKQTWASRILTASLYAVFVTGVLLTLTLPLMFDYYARVLGDTYYPQPAYRAFVVAFLLINGALGLWIVWELIRMLRTIATGPFVRRNTNSLQRTGFLALAMAILFFGKCFRYFTILTLGCGFLLLICSLFAFTLASLFRQAVALREENDLTI